MESLEARCVPASGKVHALLAPAARAVKVGGELVITGSGTFAVTIRLNTAKLGQHGQAAGRHAVSAADDPLPLASGTVKISSPGHKTVQVQVKNLSSLRINGGSGDDSISLKGKVPDRFSIIIDPKEGAYSISTRMRATVVKPPNSSGPTGPGLRPQTPAMTVELTPMAQEIVDRVNQARAGAGLGALSAQWQLTQAADISAKLMVATNQMSHEFPDSPGLQTASQRVNSTGYRYLWFGENVAAGYTTAEAVVTAWMNSPGHRANILENPATDVGISIGQTASGYLYFCLVVGNSSGA